MDYFPEIVQAVAGKGFLVFAYFSDGSIRKFEVAPLIEKGGVFSALADESVFADRITVMHGTVAWDLEGNRDETRCIDLDPLVVYEKSVVVPDPLDDVA